MLDSLLEILLPLLLASLAAVAVFGRIKVPSPLAYVVVGIVLGPGGIALVAHSQDVHFLSELGVAFLLFPDAGAALLGTHVGDDMLDLLGRHLGPRRHVAEMPVMLQDPVANRELKAPGQWACPCP